MKDGHITEILDGAPLARLSEAERAAARAHAEVCPPCLRAYEAARLSSLLLKERAAAETAVPPFFQTRLMAALRERRAAEAPAWQRLWRSAGALVSSMAAVVLLLAGLTFVAPDTLQAEGDDPQAVAADYFSDDAVLLEQASASDDELNYGQVFEAVYESDGAEGSYGQER